MTMPTNTLEQIEPTLKQNAEKILQTLGMTPLQAMSLFYRQIKQLKGLPFPLNGSNDKIDNLQSPAQSATTEPIELYIPPEIDTMAKEAVAFEKMQGDLQKRYPNEYVAVHNGQVVDHDKDNVALLKRRKQNFPGQIVLQRHVDAEPTRTVTIRSPRVIATL